jgi:hypothetical protein
MLWNFLWMFWGQQWWVDNFVAKLGKFVAKWGNFCAVIGTLLQWYLHVVGGTQLQISGRQLWSNTCHFSDVCNFRSTLDNFAASRENFSASIGNFLSALRNLTTAESWARNFAISGSQLCISVRKLLPLPFAAHVVLSHQTWNDGSHTRSARRLRTVIHHPRRRRPQTVGRPTAAQPTFWFNSLQLLPSMPQ